MSFPVCLCPDAAPCRDPACRLQCIAHGSYSQQNLSARRHKACKCKIGPPTSGRQLYASGSKETNGALNPFNKEEGDAPHLSGWAAKAIGPSWSKSFTHKQSDTCCVALTSRGGTLHTEKHSPRGLHLLLPPLSPAGVLDFAFSRGV